MFRFTRHGWREMLIGTVVLALVGFGLHLVLWPLALVVIPVLIWLFAFFRDPERPIPEEVNVLVSPADGMVSDITEIADDPLLGGPAVRIGIFLSVFNVHINRSPCSGVVSAVTYKRGKFINAMSHAKASDENESNTVVLSDAAGKPIAVVKQIVGLIARRIICTTGVGETVARGQRIGMIKFGSRTELSIPKALGPSVVVAVGQKVRGGMDILVKLSAPVHSVAPPSTTPADEELERLSPRETPA